MVSVVTQIDTNAADSQVIKKLKFKMVKNFLDIIVMSRLQSGEESGYGVISYVHNRFGFLVSSGTIYSLLYTLERSGLIEGLWVEGSRQYKLTVKGVQVIEVVLKYQRNFQDYFISLFSKEKEGA